MPSARPACDVKGIMNTVLTTRKEAEGIAAQLTAIGLTVTEIYIPQFTNGPFPTPQDGDKKFYHFRFLNGASGFNAGQIRWTMLCCPGRWPIMITEEVAREAGKPRMPWESE